MKIKNIILSTFIFVLLLLTFDSLNTTKTIIVGKYQKTVSEFDVQAIQEKHTAFVLIGDEMVEINVLSDFKASHQENTNIVVIKRIGCFTGIIYSYQIVE